MKTLHSLLILLLLLSPAAFGQTSRASSSDASQSWSSFWRSITTAINKKDRNSLLKVMPKDFFSGGGGQSPKEWLDYIDENEKRGSWRDLRRSFTKGTRVHKEWSADGTLTRVTTDNGYYFEFRKDNKWYFAGVVGD